MHNAVTGAPLSKSTFLVRASENRIKNLIARILTRPSKKDRNPQSASISDGWPLDEDIPSYTVPISKSSAKRVSLGNSKALNLTPYRYSSRKWAGQNRRYFLSVLMLKWRCRAVGNSIRKSADRHILTASGDQNVSILASTSMLRS